MLPEKLPAPRASFHLEQLQARVLFSGTLSGGAISIATDSQLAVENFQAGPNTAPTVTSPAAAFPALVTGNTTQLSVLGADAGGESNLTYTWSTTGSPPAVVNFSANGTNAAKDVTAMFSQAGTYAFLVTITDGGGLSTTSSVNVTVEQTATSILVSPAGANVQVNQQVHFSATELDQFGQAMTPHTSFAWTLINGSGSIANDGNYTAPPVIGTATVEATSGSLSGSTLVSVENTAPVVSQAAAASPNVVTGATTDLTVAGTDAGGNNNLSYTWSVLSKPAGATTPTFSVNGNNNGSHTTATFYDAGNYQFEATITDASGLSTTSDVAVQVSQTLTSISISPPATMTTHSSQQMAATALDQFGLAMAAQPAITWSANAGSFTASGLYNAPHRREHRLSPRPAAESAARRTIDAVADPAVIASPSSVSGTTTSLTAAGLGGLGSSYTWSVLSMPPGATALSFSVNNSGSNATTVTFFQAGTYTFQAVSTNLLLFHSSATISVAVTQTLSAISVSPASAGMNENGSQQFAATGYDQFGQAMAGQPHFQWAVTSGGGNVSGSGNYVAPSTATTAMVTAASGLISGSASVTVTNAAPTVVAAASSNPPSPTAPGTVNLNVRGADDGGAANLIYTWSVTGTPPGPVGFSANNVNSAQNTTATVFAPGTYHFLATITDAGGLSVTSAVDVTFAADPNQPPTITVPAAQQTTENSPLRFSAAR